MLTEDQIRPRLRGICLALESAEQTVTFPLPTFRLNGKMFSIFEEYNGELGLREGRAGAAGGFSGGHSIFFARPTLASMTG
jgi:hypothetical protein